MLQRRDIAVVPQELGTQEPILEYGFAVDIPVVFAVFPMSFGLFPGFRSYSTTDVVFGIAFGVIFASVFAAVFV